MPTEIENTPTGAEGFIFPDELQGVSFLLVEDAVYTAYEVREELHDGSAIDEDHEAAAEGQTPAYGRWLRADVTGRDDEQWIAAPGELIEELQTWDDPTGGRLMVSRCEKSGPAESDPYEVNVTPNPEP